MMSDKEPQCSEKTALKAEIRDLRARLDDAAEALRAISEGEVDALVAQVSGEPKLFVLQTSDVASNRFHSEILSKVSDAVVAFDEDYHVTYLNVAAEIQYGVKASDVLGRHVSVLYQNQPRENASEIESALEETGYWLGESLHLKLDGGILHVESSVSRISDPDGAPAGVLHVIRDISQRREAEEQVRLNQFLFSTIVDQAPGGVYVADHHLSTLQVNQRARPIFSSAEPLIGRNVADVMEMLWGEEAGASITHIFRHTLETGERYIAPRFTEMREDLGVVQSYEWITQRITLPSGNYGVVCYFTDVTEQQALESALRTHASELAVADRRKDEFLAMLAHELRNPLAPILPGVEVLLMAPENPQTVLKIGNMLRRQVEQMSRLIEDLLDMSRVSTGKIELRKSSVLLSEVLERAIEQVTPLVEKSRHELVIENGLPELVLDADPHRLAQVVSNLLSNAAKYTPDGGKIVLTTRLDTASTLLIRVTDNGKGIKEAHQSKIFDLFDQGSSGPADGLGIGLTLVRSLVEMHGGTVTVASDGEGLGSAFTVKLPSSSPVLVLTEPPAPEPSEIEAAPENRKLKVLIADDGKATADILSMFFRLEGMDTTVAYNGREAVDVVKAFGPDLICLDLGMPIMDGYEAAREIRRFDETVLIIALSGWGSEEDRRRTKAAGFNEHLTKPVKPDDLRKIIDKLFPDIN